ncbi:histidine phosphatase family protein [Shewanella livingstonensis]|uniref:Histidine phosphatase family protein n=1 Tax=Shewanella livingstonensis TaxID=150120 RepID=A0A3G8LUJ3_9GAMM|nr:histidine phosphatase family protein [Shewanella livingstonensis]AZG73316.1 histidine phosphatase family protein [Shewanella livingstonensis]
MPVFFCRHGQTHWNVKGLIQGQFNSELTNVGKSQALALANKAKTHQIEHVVCSDLGRAVETGTIVSTFLGSKLEIMPEIRERGFGILQGISRTEQPQLWDAFDNKHLNDELNIQGSESASQVAIRIARTISSLCDNNTDRNVLLIGHGEWLRIFINIHNGHHPWSDFSVLPDNCEIIKIEKR